MPGADLKAARLHGTGKALEKRPIVVDDDERAVLWKLVSIEGEVFGHYEVLLTPLFMTRYALTQRLSAEKLTEEREPSPRTPGKAQSMSGRLCGDSWRSPSYGGGLVGGGGRPGGPV